MSKDITTTLNETPKNLSEISTKNYSQISNPFNFMDLPPLKIQSDSKPLIASSKSQKDNEIKMRFKGKSIIKNKSSTSSIDKRLKNLNTSMLYLDSYHNMVNVKNSILSNKAKSSRVQASTATNKRDVNKSFDFSNANCNSNNRKGIQRTMKINSNLNKNANNFENELMVNKINNMR